MKLTDTQTAELADAAVEEIQGEHGEITESETLKVQNLKVPALWLVVLQLQVL